MMVTHVLAAQKQPTGVLLEWRLVMTYEQPVLQCRQVGGEDETWQNILCINERGELDPTYTPGVAGIPINGRGHIAAVACYIDHYQPEEDDDDLPF